MVAAAPPAIVARAPGPRPFVPVLREGDAVPDAPLVDQRGRPFSLQRTGGRTTIVSFIYTRCRDAKMCPLVSAKFARMQRDLRGTPIRLVEVTLDPAYDTPTVLARYGAAYGADPRNWTLATGTPDVVDTVAERFGIVVDRPIPATVVHSEAAVVIDPSGRVVKVVDGAAWLPDDLLASARELAGIDTSPLRRARMWFASSIGALCGAGGVSGFTAGWTLALLATITAAFAVAARRAFR
ncbi:MAG TPA: SCO family protein [Candidatus Elarobacter sp.]|nr:SCO family protein [Dongiaceae bacterium]HZW53571.1 SCO family protein [Candidatus Elarobacter sp.]